MEGSQGSCNGPPPFLTKTYEMVDDPVTDSLVSWSETGYSFVVWTPQISQEICSLDISSTITSQALSGRTRFCSVFLSEWFHCLIHVGTCYLLGFRKIDPDQWEFANEEFIRGQKHLLKNIYRRKPIHSHSLNRQGSSSVPLTEKEKKEFEQVIKMLSDDKNRLQLQLQGHQKENEEYRCQVRLLSERFRNLEDRQRRVMVSLARIIDKPHVLSQFHAKKRKLLNCNDFNDECNIQDLHSLASLNANMGLDLKQIEELESSIRCWETLFLEIGETIGEEVRDFGTSLRPSPVVVTEIQTSSGDYDMDGELYSPSSHHCSPYSTDINSSPELVAPAYHPIHTPSFHHVVNLNPKPPGIGLTPNMLVHWRPIRPQRTRQKQWRPVIPCQAILSITRNVVMGGVVRDNVGFWIARLIRNIGCCSVTIAEL
ncbi:hypothetical protein CXB51_004632 [Gossypium anomalum]|uniref:HSF-type DNA-binding domain-containing protein n=1 Tax=Gossypium anomalum TaxID=47600 RepID=A0A8J6D7T9_9ROSI|nr:hypothetical protein CXB51_004632 [Gossypium anomalum]